MNPYDDLYPFQQKGVDYLVDHGGGFLWSEPGLGKTRQGIIAAKRLGGPVLVICPNSLKQWWRKEILNIYPNSSIGMAGVAGRFGSRNVQQLPERRPLPFWFILHYAGARLNRKVLSKLPWSVVLLDESHYIKNRKAQRTEAIMEITPRTAYRIGLTATPFGNNPADLWAQLRWMAPEVQGLRSYWKFFETFVEYAYERNSGRRYRKVKGGRNLKTLAHLMAGYGLRHIKKDVAPQLPPLTQTYIPLELFGDQAIYYRKLRVKDRVEMSFPAEPGEDRVRLRITNVLARMTRMEQWLSHPWSFMSRVEGIKLQWLKEWANGYTEQAVIACRFKETARRIATILKETNMSGLASARGFDAFTGNSDGRAGVAGGRFKALCRHQITGDISVKARNGIIEDWKAGNQQFLVGTIDTIGIGLSFENAHAMICFDQLYSVIKMEQLYHRVHRITTDHPVEVIYLYIQGTTNEIVLKAFTHRWKQVEMVREFLRHIQEANGGE